MRDAYKYGVSGINRLILGGRYKSIDSKTGINYIEFQFTPNNQNHIKTGAKLSFITDTMLVSSTEEPNTDNMPDVIFGSSALLHSPGLSMKLFLDTSKPF